MSRINDLVILKYKKNTCHSIILRRRSGITIRIDPGNVAIHVKLIDIAGMYRIDGLTAPYEFRFAVDRHLCIISDQAISLEVCRDGFKIFGYRAAEIHHLGFAPELHFFLVDLPFYLFSDPVFGFIKPAAGEQLCYCCICHGQM
jgi:hypothetical protein